MQAAEEANSVQTANARAREAIKQYLLSEDDGWPDAHIFAALTAQQEALEAAERILLLRTNAPRNPG